jgi:hypothetical protein
MSLNPPFMPLRASLLCADVQNALRFVEPKMVLTRPTINNQKGPPMASLFGYGGEG